MRFIILILIILSHFISYAEEGPNIQILEESNKDSYKSLRYAKELGFFAEPYVNPEIIRKMIGPLSDLGPNITAINLDEANDSNEFHSEYRLVHYPSGFKRIRFKNEFRNQWVRQELGNGHYFEYQAVGKGKGEKKDIIYIMCREFTGGSQMWFYNLAVKIEDDTWQIHRMGSRNIPTKN